MARRLYRSRTDRMIAGVCGGLADYVGIDTILVRLIFVLLAFAHGLGLIAYVILALAVPRGDARLGLGAVQPRESLSTSDPSRAEMGPVAEYGAPPAYDSSWLEDEKRARARRRYMGGVFLLVLGLVFLVINFNLLWWLDLGRFWPLILIAIGVVILLQRRKS